MPTRPPMFKPKFQPSTTVDQERGTAAQRGYDSQWRRFRAAYLAQNPICAFLDHPAHKHECSVAATIVDHVRPLSTGGARLDPSNCRPVCRAAHDRLTLNLKAKGWNEIV